MFESIWEIFGSGAMAVTALLLALPVFRERVPELLDSQIINLGTKVWRLIFYPYIEITFTEYTGEHLKRCEIYAAIEAYLGELCPHQVVCLKAAPRDGASVVLSMDNREEVAVKHDGVKFWWSCNTIKPKSTSIYFRDAPDDRRFYRLTFHRRHRRYRDSYIKFVIQKGKEVEVKERQRKLYTNAKVDPSRFYYRNSLWSHVQFKHPATFKTLAMDEDKKREIMEDLIRFSQGKDYYASVGKPWKRGYLLYGPPGTGKSTMIAAMANLLKYDVYDLELTSVKDNTTLRKLLIETKSKSIIMIEDIDCSLELWERRNKREETAGPTCDEEELKAEIKGKCDKEESKVTLSGLLNFIDGLWSTCDGGERIIVFTTNHVEKLDPALLRRGRMDVRVKMSYCSFEGFKTLAKNYLGIESHQSFDRIRKLLEDNYVSQADVAESLMPKRSNSPLFDGIRSRIESGEISLGDEQEISLMPKSGSEIKDEEFVSRHLDGLIQMMIENGRRCRPSNGSYSEHIRCERCSCVPATQLGVPWLVHDHPICSDNLCNPCGAQLPDGISSLCKDSGTTRSALTKPSRPQQQLLLSKLVAKKPVNNRPAPTGKKQTTG